MATLEIYRVKPDGVPRMTVTALDDQHLGYILRDICKNGAWKQLTDEVPVEIMSSVGKTSKPMIKDFRA